MGFGSFLLAGVFVNSIPQILRTVTGVINTIVDFVTPIQSAFSLIVGFIQGDFDKKKYDVDKKRVDDSQEIAIRRYQTYEDNIKPVIDFYKQTNLLKVVNGETSITEISTEISALIEAI